MVQCYQTMKRVDSKNDEDREYDQAQSSSHAGCMDRDRARSAIFNDSHHPKTTDFMITLFLNQVCEERKKKEKKEEERSSKPSNMLCPVLKLDV